VLPRLRTLAGVCGRAGEGRARGGRDRPNMGGWSALFFFHRMERPQDGWSEGRRGNIDIFMGQLDPCHSNFLKLDLMLKIMPLSGMIFNMTPNFTELWWHESNFPVFFSILGFILYAMIQHSV